MGWSEQDTTPVAEECAADALVFVAVVWLVTLVAGAVLLALVLWGW
jgi:hypothetical protein